MNLKDLIKPCRDFAVELYNNKMQGGNNYGGLTLDELVTKLKSPLEVKVKLKNRSRKSIVFHCGKMTYNKNVDGSKNGWCATKFDKTGKIERWGYCSENCKDKRTSFTFTNINLLSLEECRTLLDTIDLQDFINLQEKYEFCAGKKHEFPTGLASFVRRRKRRKQLMKEKQVANRLKSPVKPSPYNYKFSRSRTRVSLGVPEKYPYDWFIGGVDSCQGDSGGPLWRNIKVRIVKCLLHFHHCIDFRKILKN